MISFKKILVLSTWLTSVISSPIQAKQQATGSLDSWLASESPAALQGVLNNIGANGSKAPGALPGVVVASPSMVDPPCMSLRLVPAFVEPNMCVPRFLLLDSRFRSSV